MPPSWMWPLAQELEKHFEAVKERRQGGRTHPDDDEPAGPVIRNEYARGRGRNV